jgi:xylitol oxidase
MTKAAAMVNWAGNIDQARRFRRPSSPSDLQKIVSTRPRVRAMGAGHCFNRIATPTATSSG